MNKALFAVFLLVVIGLSGCGTTARIDSSLKASEYNDIASKYMARPTFIQVRKLKGDDDRLEIMYDKYDQSVSSITFVKEYVDDYIALIDKYLKWEALATRNRDMFKKEIGKADLWAGVSLQFTFYSGNATNHFLVIGTCSLGLCGGPNDTVFDKQNVITLRDLLLKFKAGSLNQTDTSQYN